MAYTVNGKLEEMIKLLVCSLKYTVYVAAGTVCHNDL